jgi:homoserine O-succinyltransferase/O-acetyltransferase
LDRVIKIALLDLNNGFENQGMRCIREITHAYFQKHQLPYEVEEFDVRQKNEVPNSSFDIYLSSGGPGSPFDEEGWEWEHKYFKLVNKLYLQNQEAAPENKKFIFFICHSFQIACRIFRVGNVCERKSTSFGVFPMTKVEGGLDEPVFNALDNPFYGVDSRDFQVIEPNRDVLEDMGAQILAIEKERPHIPLERAIMGIRFSPEMIGTQFHPEADAVSMRKHLLEEDKKKQIIALHGEDKYNEMIDRLEDPDKIMHTQATILPTFLDIATANFK